MARELHRLLEVYTFGAHLVEIIKKEAFGIAFTCLNFEESSSVFKNMKYHRLMLSEFILRFR